MDNKWIGLLLLLAVASMGVDAGGQSFGHITDPTSAGTAGQCLMSSGTLGVADTWGPCSGATPTPSATPTPVISGGGSISTGSGPTGRLTSLATSSNVLTLPGFPCTNAMTCVFQDDTTVGGVKVTSQTTTSETFSATSGDTADYICGCR